LTAAINDGYHAIPLTPFDNEASNLKKSRSKSKQNFIASKSKLHTSYSKLASSLTSIKKSTCKLTASEKDLSASKSKLTTSLSKFNEEDEKADTNVDDASTKERKAKSEQSRRKSVKKSSSGELYSASSIGKLKDDETTRPGSIDPVTDDESGDESSTESDEDEQPKSKAKSKKQITVYLRFYKCDTFSRPPMQKFVPKLICPPVPNTAWIAVDPQPPPDITGFSPIVDRVTMFIDAARFLPDNVTAVKFTARVYSPTRKAIVDKKFESEVKLDTPVYFPVFDCKFSVPKSAVKKDCLLMIDFYTCDRYTSEPVQLGCACLSLMAVALDNDIMEVASDLKIRTGAFQLPIMLSQPSLEQLLDHARLSDCMRITCASVLVRVITENSKGIDYH
jgi:hypothetical protein